MKKGWTCDNWLYILFNQSSRQTFSLHFVPKTRIFIFSYILLQHTILCIHFLFDKNTINALLKKKLKKDPFSLFIDNTNSISMGGITFFLFFSRRGYFGGQGFESREGFSSYIFCIFVQNTCRGSWHPR